MHDPRNLPPFPHVFFSTIASTARLNHSDFEYIIMSLLVKNLKIQNDLLFQSVCDTIITVYVIKICIRKTGFQTRRTSKGLIS